MGAEGEVAEGGSREESNFMEEGQKKKEEGKRNDGP